jgi:hypothetical protein
MTLQSVAKPHMAFPRKFIGIVIFTIVAVLFALGYTLYLTAKGGSGYVENESAYSEAGGGLASITVICLGLIYGRSILKLLVNHGSFWDRLGQITDSVPARTLSQKGLKVLNRTHPYIGIIAIASVYLHCIFTGKTFDNLLLLILLVVMGSQGISGLILKFKYTPRSMKKMSFLLHIQFYVGIAIIVLAGFGHMLMGD